MWALSVAKDAAPAFQAFANLMRKHNYLFRESAGGTYNCRQISGNRGWSVHAYAVGIDLNPSKNPYGTAKTDMPKAFTDAVLALRTNNGKQVFTWGMNWTPTSAKDPMHFQINCSPADVRTGIAGQTPPPPNGDDEDMAETTKGIQRSLNASGFKGKNGAVLTVDGVWGDNTEFAFTNMCKDAASDTGGITAAEVDTKIANHAKVKASATVHPHAHAEGTTGPPA
jgi:hypothetical protein